MTRDSAMGAAVAAVDALREGDAWYAAQTHASLARYAVEEGHEVAAAAEALDAAGTRGGAAATDPARRDALRDELGDLLLQVLLHARLASERGGGLDLDDVAASLTAKARRRHPHVFEGSTGRHAPTVAELEAGWEALKDAERGGRDPLDDLPATLPALVRAQKVLALAERAGVAVLPAPSPLGSSPQEPPPPAPGSTPAPGPDRDRIGADLLALAERARRAGLDAESELRAAVRALEARTRAATTTPSTPATTTPAPATADRGA